MSAIYAGPAIRVVQPIGEFWVASIPASVLLRATTSDRLRLLAEPRFEERGGELEEWLKAGALEGTQRVLELPRLKQIAAFIRTLEATFPNSIILSVDEASAVEDDGDPWQIEAHGREGFATLRIPENGFKARVVDGQHRLYAFAMEGDEPVDFDLVCAVFFGLPRPMQAYVFATINTNQKPVRRGLAMNLYGYNVEDQPRGEWSPEKLAVFMARRLNFEEDSPLHLRVRIEAEGAPPPERLAGAKRPIPMAAVVDAGLGLISRNPIRDRDKLRQWTLGFSKAKRRKVLDADRADQAPLRGWYLEESDADTYALLKAYFGVVSDLCWSGERAILTRAVDIRALGDFLGDLVRPLAAGGHSEAIAAVVETSREVFAEAHERPFDHPFFEATYRGRRRVRNGLRLLAGEPIEEQIPPDDRAFFAEHFAR